MKTRCLLIIGLAAAGCLLLSWRVTTSTFGQTAPDQTPDQTYDSPVGQFTLPTQNTTAGTLDTDYKLAAFFFGLPKVGPVSGDNNGNTGNGFKDRYAYENLNAFNLTQAASQIGDLDTLDPRNVVVGPGGRPINPGFRFVHISDTPFIWRIGEESDTQRAQQVIVFPIIDHLFDPETSGYGPNAANPPAGGLGNVVLEALEFTVWGTDDQAEAINASLTTNYFGVGGRGTLPANGKWSRATLVKVFAEGFKDYNGLSPFAPFTAGFTPSPQEGDDFASLWEFRDASGNPVAVKYVAVYANKTRDTRFFVPDATGKIPGNLAQSTDAEIDAVGFVPFTAPPPPDTKCKTLCFRSARYYLMHLNQLPRGSVIIGGFNFNGPTSTTNTAAIQLALRRGDPLNRPAPQPLDRLNREYVAAQLTVLSIGGMGAPAAIDALWSTFRCNGLDFAPVTLSNGAKLTPDSMLKELFMQAQFAIDDGRTVDMLPLAQLFFLLNGDDISGRCS